MALKLNERYPGRFNNPTTSYPQGSFKNRTAPTAQDGSYLEQDWMNDIMGFLGRLITVSGVTLNGNVDTALSSQYYDAMSAIFAKLASPALTGVPTAPTAAVGTNTTQISTTAFVQAAIATLGTAASRNVGTGTNQIPDMSSFQFSITGDNGYFRLPNGIIRQFGFVVGAAAGAVTNVTFPIPFPTKRLNQGFSVASPATSPTVHSVLEFITPSLTGFGIANIAAIVAGNSAVASPVTAGFYWWAEGY